MKSIRQSLMLGCLIVGTLGFAGCATCHPSPRSESNPAEDDGLLLIWLGYIPIPIPTHLWWCSGWCSALLQPAHHLFPHQAMGGGNPAPSVVRRNHRPLPAHPL